jgi:hypothetical protein
MQETGRLKEWKAARLIRKTGRDEDRKIHGADGKIGRKLDGKALLYCITVI